MSEYSIPSFNESNTSERPSRSRGSHERRRGFNAKRPVIALAAAGGLAVAGMVGFGVSRYKDHTATIEKLQQDENDLVRTMQSSGLQESTRVFQLNSGVKIRSTPGRVNDSFHGLIGGNVEQTVGDDQEIIVSQPIWKVDKDGVWMGFSEDLSESKATQRTPEEIAKSLRWVDYSNLYDAKDANGNPYITTYKAATPYKTGLGKAAMSPTGLVTFEGAHNAFGHGAVALEEDKGQAERLLALYGVTPLQAPNEPAH